jgi:hypothetical protein
MFLKITRLLLATLSFFSAVQYCHAKSNTKLIIENNFVRRHLYFRVTDDIGNLIDLDKQSFKIAPNKNKTIGVRADQSEPEAEAYLQTKFTPFLHTRTILKGTAFWGVKVIDSNNIDLSGYIAPANMAYSWKGGAANVKKIAFCTPKYFIEHDGSCEG